MSNNKLKEIRMGDYILAVGPSEEDSKRCYQIINTVTDVVEVETKLLPQAYKYLNDISSALDAMRDLQKEDKGESSDYDLH